MACCYGNRAKDSRDVNAVVFLNGVLGVLLMVVPGEPLESFSAFPKMSLFIFNLSAPFQPASRLGVSEHPIPPNNSHTYIISLVKKIPTPSIYRACLVGERSINFAGIFLFYRLPLTRTTRHVRQHINSDSKT